MKNALLTDAEAAPAKTILPGSGPDLMQQARRLGIPGRSNMSVPELREAVGEAVKKASAPRGGAAAKMRREMAAQEAPAAEPTQEAAMEQPAQDFDAQLAELQQLLAESGSEPQQADTQSYSAAQTMQPPPAYAPQQNRLLAGR